MAVIIKRSSPHSYISDTQKRMSKCFHLLVLN